MECLSICFTQTRFKGHIPTYAAMLGFYGSGRDLVCEFVTFLFAYAFLGDRPGSEILPAPYCPRQTDAQRRGAKWYRVAGLGITD